MVKVGERRRMRKVQDLSVYRGHLSADMIILVRLASHSDFAGFVLVLWFSEPPRSIQADLFVALRPYILTC